jgi:ribosome production factor 1
MSALAARASALGKRKTRPAEIGNKMKRREVHRRDQQEKRRLKAEDKARRAKLVKELGDQAPAKQVPKSLDAMREHDDTLPEPDDEEVMRAIEEDEFAPYYRNEKEAKIMITTRPRPSKNLFTFVGDLLTLLPKAFFYPRKTFTLKQIVGWAQKKEFTHLLVLNEKNKVCNALLVSHLPAGPTACFKVTNIVPSNDIQDHGRSTDHRPEIILNNFNTRLGLRVGRLFGSMFPHEPEFRGRQVVTMHNQRDFIFVRHHRYMFREGTARKGENKAQIVGKDGKTAVHAAMQELGPRFTLKMRWLQAGTFDTKEGEYEWILKRSEMETSRRRFFL